MTTNALGPIALVGLDPDSALAVALAGAGHRVHVIHALDDDRLTEAGLVIQAGVEEPDAAAATFAALGEVTAPEALIVTASATLAITDLAAATEHPGRVAGLCVFTGGPGEGTVEIVRARQTSQASIDRLVALVESLDKVPVVTKDRPGRLLNALFLPYLNDVVQEYDDELASAEDIDVALQLGLGYRVGPLELLDRQGLDEHLRLTRAVHELTHDDRYAPPPLLLEMVAAGHLGEKSGTGFRRPANT